MVKYCIDDKIIFSDKGDFRYKINVIASKLNSFGGTYIFFDRGLFYFGCLSLYSINYNAVQFIDYSTNCTYSFSLNQFSNSFLFTLFITFLNQCKKSLTENAFEEIVKELEEKLA